MYLALSTFYSFVYENGSTIHKLLAFTLLCTLFIRIDIAVLAELALRFRNYAKALHYIFTFTYIGKDWTFNFFLFLKKSQMAHFFNNRLFNLHKITILVFFLHDCVLSSFTTLSKKLVHFISISRHDIFFYHCR